MAVWPRTPMTSTVLQSDLKTSLWMLSPNHTIRTAFYTALRIPIRSTLNEHNGKRFSCAPNPDMSKIKRYKENRVAVNIKLTLFNINKKIFHIASCFTVSSKN